MSRLFRRLYTTASSSPSAAETASAFLARAHSSPPVTRTQVLDSNQLDLLSSTLSHPLQPHLPPNPPSSSSSSSSPSPATATTAAAAAVAQAQARAIPPAHHLVYFTPSQPEADLGPDGTDTSYNPPAPFTRRMWAGGELRWASENLLRVGQRVTETTTVRSAEAKRTRAGEEMVVVGVEKVFANERGWAVLDRRNWIFRRALPFPSPSSSPSASQPPPPPPPPAAPRIPFPTGAHTLDITQTPVSLFRFSALTFNGHRIHYDREWCRAVEGHRDLVVHGPLNLIHMLDFWRDVMVASSAAAAAAGGLRGRAHRGEMGDIGEELVFPKRVTYRNTGPLYVGEMYRIVMDEEKRYVDSSGDAGEAVSDVRVVDGAGVVAMVGRIERTVFRG